MNDKEKKEKVLRKFLGMEPLDPVFVSPGTTYWAIEAPDVWWLATIPTKVAEMGKERYPVYDWRIKRWYIHKVCHNNVGVVIEGSGVTPLEAWINAALNQCKGVEG